MRSFIAGHKGMVGSSLVRNAPDWAEIVTANRRELDLTKPSEVANFLIKNNVESVLLAAALVGGIAANASNQYKFLYGNLEIQNGVIEGSRRAGIKNLIFLGSSCVYPKFAPQPISEKSLLTAALEETNDGYAIAKIAGLRLCRAINEQFGENFLSLMPANLYGPNDNFHRENSHVPAGLLRRFHEAKLTGAPTVTVWGSGKPYREFLYVDDLADACWYFLSFNSNESLLNIGTGQEITINHFANLISNIVGYSGKINFDGSKPDGTPRKLLNIEKATNFGWTSKVDLQKGLELTYDWFTLAYERGDIRGYD